jgi:hypothetical protein
VKKPGERGKGKAPTGTRARAQHSHARTHTPCHAQARMGGATKELLEGLRVKKRLSEVSQ